MSEYRMAVTIRRVRWIAAVAFLAARCAVSPVQYSGTVTEGGNTTGAVVSGVLVQADGSPAANTVVSLRPVSFVPTVGPGLLARSARSLGDTVTDHTGHFSFSGIDDGVYYLYAAQGETLAAGREVIVKDALDPVNDQPLRLVAAGRISGTCLFNTLRPVHAVAALYGIDRQVLVDSLSGTYSLGGIPPGTFTLCITYPDAQGLVSIDVPDLQVAGGAQVVVDTVRIQAVVEEDYRLWPFQATVRLNTTAQGADSRTPVADFAVLVRLDGANFDFSNSSSDGHDLRFADAAGRHLACEVELFDQVAQTAAVWVAVDTIYPDTIIDLTMYWGQSDALRPAAAGAVFRSSPWDAAVWHLGNGADRERPDASDNFRDAEALFWDGDERKTGLIGRCDSFDLRNDVLTAPGFSPDAQLTLQAWVNLSTWIDWGYVIASALDTPTGPWSAYGLQCTNRGEIAMTVAIDGKERSVSAPAALLNTWVLVSGTCDGQTLRLYIDGEEMASAAVSGRIDATTQPVTLGHLAADPRQRICGKIDEVRIAQVARSAAWIRLCHFNQGQDDRLVTILR